MQIDTIIKLNFPYFGILAVLNMTNVVHPPHTCNYYEFSDGITHCLLACIKCLCKFHIITVF